MGVPNTFPWYELNEPRRRRERATRGSLTLTRIVLLPRSTLPFGRSMILA
ncbi:hypothetical protein LguiA_004841 [Lonicera macranthoides]